MKCVHVDGSEQWPYTLCFRHHWTCGPRQVHSGEGHLWCTGEWEGHSVKLPALVARWGDDHLKRGGQRGHLIMII